MKSRIKLLGLAAALLLLLPGCAPGQSPGDSGEPFMQGAPPTAETGAQLQALLEAGAAEIALVADVDLGDEMLKLQGGALRLVGNGHTLSGGGACVIRLSQGAQLTIEDAVIAGEQTAIGILQDGCIGGEGALSGGRNALQAGGAVDFAPDSRFAIAGETGSGILAQGLSLGENAALTIKAALFAVNAGNGDITLRKGASLACTALGDNVVKTEGTLRLQGETALTAVNQGEYNAVKAGTLAAEPTASVELTCGAVGVSLFVVEQYEDVALRGRCTGDVQVELGGGEIQLEG